MNYLILLFTVAIVFFTIWHALIIRYKYNWIMFLIGILCMVIFYLNMMETFYGRTTCSSGAICVQGYDSNLPISCLLNFVAESLLVFQVLYLMRDIWLYFSNKIKKRRLVIILVVAFLFFVITLVSFYFVYGGCNYYPDVIIVS